MLLGFDVGGTKCAVILGKTGDENETIHVVDKEVTPTNRPAYQMIELLFTMAESILLKHAITNKKLQGIGISLSDSREMASQLVL